jgi:hypothetical protein
MKYEHVSLIPAGKNQCALCVLLQRRKEFSEEWWLETATLVLEMICPNVGCERTVSITIEDGRFAVLHTKPLGRERAVQLRLGDQHVMENV